MNIPCVVLSPPSCLPLLLMKHILALFGGFGAHALSDALVVNWPLYLVPASRTAHGRAVQVAYLGIATYDLPEPQKQTGELTRHGCCVRPTRASRRTSLLCLVATPSAPSSGGSD